MPITIEHGASPTTLMTAAYATGLGYRRQRDEDRMDKLLAERRHFAQQRELLGMRGEQHREFLEMQGQQQRDEEIREQLRKGELELDPLAQTQLEEARRARVKVQTDRRLTDRDRSEILRQIDAEERSALRTAQPKTRQELTAKEKVEQGVFWDAGEWGKGTPWVVDPESGLPQVARGWKPPEQQQDKKADLSSPSNYQAAYKATWDQLVAERKLETASKPNAETGETAPIQSPKREEVEARMREAGYTVPSRAATTTQQQPQAEQPSAGGAPTEPVAVSSKEQYDALPSGTPVRFPDGRTGRKP